MGCVDGVCVDEVCVDGVCGWGVCGWGVWMGCVWMGCVWMGCGMCAAIGVRGMGGCVCGMSWVCVVWAWGVFGMGVVCELGWGCNGSGVVCFEL